MAEPAALLDRVSAVVPALNAAETIRQCVDALDGLGEVIVVDGGSSDGTRKIARRAGATVIGSERGRGVQLRTGAAVAKGDWLLFLHADTLLGDGWRPSVQRHAAGEWRKAGYFRFRLRSGDRRARLVELGAGLRCRLLALPFGDQGLLISSGLYREVGGYSAMPLMEDVDIVRRLGRGRLAALSADALTSAARWEGDGWARRSLGNLTIQMLYFAGASPERLARLYR